VELVPALVRRGSPQDPLRNQSWGSWSGFWIALIACVFRVGKTKQSLALFGFTEFWPRSSADIQKLNTPYATSARACLDIDALLPRSCEFTHKILANMKSHFLWTAQSASASLGDRGGAGSENATALAWDQHAATGPSLSSGRETPRQWLSPVA